MGSHNLIKRCSWVGIDPLYINYHDKEWGVPTYDDQTLFEFLCLEGQQAGLSWITVLKKREDYKRLFYNFDISKVSNMSDLEIEKLLLNKLLIRNKLKLYSIRNNAFIFKKVQKEYGSFSNYIWAFVDEKTNHCDRENEQEVPSRSEISDEMSKDLKLKGFKFIGSTVCYSFMQAAGLINDHSKDCFRYCDIKKME